MLKIFKERENERKIQQFSINIQKINKNHPNIQEERWRTLENSYYCWETITSLNDLLAFLKNSKSESEIICLLVAIHQK